MSELPLAGVNLGLVLRPRYGGHLSADQPTPQGEGQG